MAQASSDLPARTAAGCVLRLYVSGDSVRSRRAIAVVKSFAGACDLEVVDVLSAPARAEEDRIIATPTLVRVEPPPVTRLIGELRDAETVAERLGIVTMSDNGG